MERFAYKTRGMTAPGGRPNVYLCCHPDDRAQYLEPVAEELLRLQDCVVWFAKTDDAPRDEDFLEILTKKMQLLVMPVTEKLLKGSNVALTEFRAARAAGVHILPLMQGVGLEQEFDRVCGQLQFLSSQDADPTAIPYEEKLKKYLSSVLVDAALAQKVRAAFDAYVFLSYRKKDRKYANDLMRMIHAGEACRDVAIWYDEYLVPGEDFNDAIDRMLRRCDLFVLAVTPNLLENPNYVMDIEYPEAKKAGKPVIPVEMVPTDREALLRGFEGLQLCVTSQQPEEVSRQLHHQLRSLALDTQNSTPEHLYYIGLAYLNGIDVEVDRQRGEELLTRAASAGCAQAMEKLVDLYCAISDSQLKGSQWLNKRLELVRQPEELAESDALAFLEFCESHELSGTRYGVWNVVDWAQRWVDVSRLWNVRLGRDLQHEQALFTCASVMTGLLQGKLGTVVLNGHEEYPDAYYEAGRDAYLELEELALPPEARMQTMLGKARLENGYARCSRYGLLTLAKGYIRELLGLAKMFPGDLGARYEVYGLLELDEILRRGREKADDRPIISEPMEFGEALSGLRPTILKPKKLEYEGDIAVLQQAVEAAKRLEGNALADHLLRLRLMRTCAEHYEWKKAYATSVPYWCEAVEAARQVWEQTRREEDRYELAFLCGCAARVYDQLEQPAQMEAYLEECFHHMQELYRRYGWDVDRYGYIYRDCVDYLAAYWKVCGDGEKQRAYEELSKQCDADNNAQLDRQLKEAFAMWDQMKAENGW